MGYIPSREIFGANLRFRAFSCIDGALPVIVCLCPFFCFFLTLLDLLDSGLFFSYQYLIMLDAPYEQGAEG